MDFGSFLIFGGFTELWSSSNSSENSELANFQISNELIFYDSFS
jgi:hypothetical protein